MKKLKKILALLLAVEMLASLSLNLLTGCNQPEDPDTPPENGDDDSGNNGGGSSSGERQTYTVQVKTLGGMAMPDLNVYVYKDATLEDLAGQAAVTDKNGIATLSLKPGNTYHATLTGVPRGYNVQPSYAFNGNSCVITLASEVIKDSSQPTSYKLGDVMRDFSVADSDGNTFTLSEALKTKDAVLINFWYTTCSWCVKEFPYMQKVYAGYEGVDGTVYPGYSDDIAIIALDPDPGDSLTAIQTFKADMGITFQMAQDYTTLTSAFGVTGYPTSVIVDRYGVICMIESGGIVDTAPFHAMFDHFTSDNYQQKLITDINELTPAEKPIYTMPSSADIGSAFNAANSTVTVEFTPETNPTDAEYSWPFIINTKKFDTPCIQPSNFNRHSSFSTMYAKLHLNEGDVVAFDYYTSTEQGADILYVLVDREDIYQISGQSNVWKSCYTYVALEEGDYEIAFIYVKDSSDHIGEDTVYLDNFRITTVDNITVDSYIPRFCANGVPDNGFGFLNYSTVGLATDGYYHVDVNKDGSFDTTEPYLLADLMNYSRFSPSASIYELAYNGKITVGGVDYYDQLLPYFSYASNSEISGFCTVNAELASLLRTVATAVGIEGHDNEWLQICQYYDAYPQGVMLPDPIRGLATFSAFETFIGSVGDNEYPNSFTYNRIIMPRGLKARFTPTVSGVYRISSRSEAPVDAWIFLEDNEQYYIYEGDEKLYMITEEAENNCSMVVYLEAGVDYYIDIAFENVYGTGTIDYRIDFIGETYSSFVLAAPGFFTYYESDGNSGGINEIVALSIQMELDGDGFYREKLANGELGSKIYAEFELSMPIFSHSINEMIEAGSFNFALTDDDHYVLNYLKAWTPEGESYTDYGYNEFFKEKFMTLWGADNYDTYFEIYKPDEVLAGIYHGTGENLTDEMREYAQKAYTSTTAGSATELIGCVEVDEQLATLLQKLMDKYTFSGVDFSWAKCCFYYKQYPAPQPTDE